MNCPNHGSDWMDSGVCLACEDLLRQEEQEALMREEQRQIEEREMEEHFRRHPHG